VNGVNGLMCGEALQTATAPSQTVGLNVGENEPPYRRRDRRGWGHDQDPTTNGIHQAVKKVNTILTDAGLTWSLSYTKGHIVRS